MVSEMRASKTSWKNRSVASGSRVVSAKWPMPLRAGDEAAGLHVERGVRAQRLREQLEAQPLRAHRRPRTARRRAGGCFAAALLHVDALRPQALQRQLQRLLVVELPAERDHVLGRTVANDEAARVPRRCAARARRASARLDVQAQAVAGEALPFVQPLRLDQQVAEVDVSEQAGYDWTIR